MELIIVKNYEEMSEKTFKIIKNVIKEKENPVISMTTGGTPRGLFKKLANAFNNDLNIEKVKFLNLDEYIGEKNAPYTVYRYMNENLFDLVSKKPLSWDHIHGDEENIEKEIERYKNVLDNTKRDVQVLGLGVNGHIGANEPGTPFDSTIFLADHDKSTIESTANEYNIDISDAPNQMVTMGFEEILEADKVLLMVSGSKKAEAVKNVLNGPISTACPASYLRDKDNVIMIIDEDAASLLEK
ncbi:glucosamine-6-phosphate deaminase [Anaerococcus rubeinfantis]|uniref:glucosamine-6-phosphate deaminase n=1 Tax=Anaerococcus rubeinfantis TaxID=1720199 RepID=UPI00073E6043|nr:glucosamine-6-phosphate deaminase [Anaerococcus rubeinfantis]